MAILPEFLSFKYEGVRTVDEIMSNPTAFGWKCRKYLRWKDVQNEPSDRDALRLFADALINTGEFNPKLYGAINRIFLNVQKWRIDKKDFAIEPPFRAEWAAFNGLSKVAMQSPAIIPEELFNRDLEVEGRPSESLQVFFYIQMLDEFLRSYEVTCYHPIELKSFCSRSQQELSRELRLRLEPVYASVGLVLNQGLTLTDQIQNIYSDLGVKMNIDPSIPISSIPVTQPLSERVVIEYTTLERFKLVQLTTVEDTLFVRINSRHPYVERLASSKEQQESFEMLLRAYALAAVEMPAQKEALSNFTDYLGLWLMRLHQSKYAGKKVSGT